MSYKVYDTETLEEATQEKRFTVHVMAGLHKLLKQEAAANELAVYEQMDVILRKHFKVKAEK